MRIHDGRMVRAYSAVILAVIVSLSLCSISSSSGQKRVRRPRRDNNYKQDYNFTTNWFTQHIPIWTDVLEEFKNREDIHYLEVGVYEGRAMIWVLENVLTHPSAKATALDIFPDDLQERFTRNIQKSGFADKVSVIKGGSQIVLRDLPPASCDIIYIDGDHSAPAVLADALYSWPLLKEGGILIFDDYLYKIEERPPEKRPKISIDAFASSFREYIDTLSMEKQFIVRKKAKIYWEDF